ncbi:hypothetical protein UY3_13775 [Chelonia mydas]|uniref:Uncharacterized protein n=1 Tax=Chelonia mydas TaxID=8469 RepID=M7AUJ4_CHEMY|nr:hypothetical protein UY3_13775 [Chelonia mydas]
MGSGDCGNCGIATHSATLRKSTLASRCSPRPPPRQKFCHDKYQCEQRSVVFQDSKCEVDFLGNRCRKERSPDDNANAARWGRSFCQQESQQTVATLRYS